MFGASSSLSSFCQFIPRNSFCSLIFSNKADGASQQHCISFGKRGGGGGGKKGISTKFDHG